jgi:hypothetical protein
LENSSSIGNCNNDKSNLEPDIIGIPEACRTDLKNAKHGRLLKHGKLFDNNDKSNLEPNIIGIPEACRTDLKTAKAHSHQLYSNFHL